MIRKAKPSDVDQILAELKNFAAFYGTKRSLFPTDPDRAAQILMKLIDEHLFFVALKRDKVVGFIAGFVTRHVFNPDILVLSESLWWVNESVRHSFVAARLLATFKEWGLANVDWITMAIEHRSPLKPSALERWGFKSQERSYLLEVN